MGGGRVGGGVGCETHWNQWVLRREDYLVLGRWA